jgi:ATP-dependent Zn protease
MKCAPLWEEELRKVTFNRIWSIKRFKKVTKQARAMVTVYGLNEKLKRNVL